jgi:16S rRNA (cytosine967-C5)-methyltransferase
MSLLNSIPLSRTARQLALVALRSIERGAFADVALDRAMQQMSLADVDRQLATELVYGTVRRQRTLDALVDQFAKKPAHQQPPDLRLILHLGLYQLRYLSHIPPSAAVDTAVELARHQGLTGLTGVVNGLLRAYLRQCEAGDPLQLPNALASRLGTLHSYPDWIVQLWLDQFGLEQTEQLCQWFNQPPTIDLRVNTHRTTLAAVEAVMQTAGITVQRLPLLPQALRLVRHAGAIQQLPGFAEGWWTVQDSSAQLVSLVVDPQPGEVVIDACAAPGGKTTHLAELMQDSGVVWACDRSATRLKKVQQNADRLQLHSIRTCAGDSRMLTQFEAQGDRVLVDAPCSGLGTLHRHADARWRQTPETATELATLQLQILQSAATWVKPDGKLIYATCTLHPQENEAVIQAFLRLYPHWEICPPTPNAPVAAFATPKGWLTVLPHRHQMDGFFIACLQRSRSG